MMMQNKQPLVSVIIPMYRVADLLPQGLEYLLNQTYKHLELLFVDDNSPDAASEIVEQYRRRFEAVGMRVCLLRHEENRGVAVARNTALDVATGEFIYSFDADDELVPNAIELMVKEALSKELDIVGCEWSLVYNGSRRSMTQPDVHTGAEAFKAMCQGVMKWNLWLWLFRRSLLSEDKPLRFLPGMNMGEDMMLMGKLFLKANKVSIIHQDLYGYVKTNASAQTNNYSEAHWEQVNANLLELERYLFQRSTEIQKQEQLQLLKLNLKLPLLISSRREDYERWTNWFPEANNYIMRNEALSLRTKLLQWVAHHKLWFLVRLYYEVVMKLLYNILYK